MSGVLLRRNASWARSRWFKVVLVSVLGFVALLFLVGLVLVEADNRSVLGKWPFKPLETRCIERPAPIGGVIIVEGVEQRGFRSDGFSWEASYRPSPDQPLERIGEWEGRGNGVDAYAVGPLLVVLNGDQYTLHVRSAEGQWRSFRMRFMEDHETLGMDFFVWSTGLTENEITRISAAVRNGYVAIEGFNPETRMMSVTGMTRAKRVRFHLRLWDDGTRLELVDLVETTTKAAAGMN